MSATARMRPLTGAAPFSCDWGYCDGESVAERLDPNTGEWLAVCTDHKAPEAKVHQRGGCVQCGKETALSTAGKIRAHDVPGTFAVRCLGSNRNPKEEKR